MKLRQMMGTALACAASLLLGACGGGNSGAVTGPSSGPQYPSVAGSWAGQWTSYGIATAATLQLNQSGDQVQGMLTVGTQVNDVAGTISQSGVLRFEGQPPRGCISYATASPHLSLERGNTLLDGPMYRLSPNLGGPCGSGPLIEEDGTLSLDKIS